MKEKKKYTLQDLKVGDQVRFSRSVPRTIIAMYKFDGDTDCVLAHKAEHYGYYLKEIHSAKHLLSCLNHTDDITKAEFIKKDGTLTPEGEKYFKKESEKADAKRKEEEERERKKKDMIVKVESYKSIKDPKLLGTKYNFYRYRRLQNSGRINMTDIVTGSHLCDMPEQIYEDIIWHYSQYKEAYNI